MNIIVIDEEKSYLYILKSILLEQKLRVSISSSLEEAKAKIDTALFDAAFFITPSQNINECLAERTNFLRHVATKFQHIPVCIIGDTDSYTQLPNIAKTIAHPIKSSDIVEAINIFNKYIINLTIENTEQKKDIELPVDVCSNNEQVKCTANNITLHSLLVEGHKLDEFNTFFTKNMNNSLDVHIVYDTNTILRLNSRVMFAEFTPARVIKSAGLSFPQVDNSQIETFKKILTG